MFDTHPSESPQFSWLLAQCRSGQEHIVADQVNRRDLAQVFLPREVSRRRWRGRWQEILRPVFPGYVFLSPHAGYRNWRSVYSLRGFSRIVSFGAHRPANVPEALINAIRLRCNEEGLLQRGESLQAGQEVRLVNGPFADLVARIEALAPGERAVLLIDLMGRQVRATVARDDLKPVASPSW